MLFISEREDLISLWDYSRNALDPKQLTLGSNRQIYLYCKKCDSSWHQITCNVARSKNFKCPFCSGRRFKSGLNDLKSLHPELCFEWDYDLNSVDPDSISVNYREKVYWRCSDCKKSWDAYTYNRINRGDSCPYCSGKRKIIGVNDLLSTHGHLCSDWHYELNGSGPELYSYGSSYQAWWRCNMHGPYKKAINKRISGQGCSRCLLKVSNSESLFADYFQSLYNGAIERNNRSILGGLELDFYMKDLATAIEFNGDYWHSSLGPGLSDEGEAFERHEKKYGKCVSRGIMLLYVWEDDFLNDRGSIGEALHGYLTQSIISPILLKFTSSIL